MLQAARNIFLQYGFRNVTIPQFAYATGYSQTSIRRQYGDLENLLALVLRAYMDTIIAAIAAIPGDAENLFPRRRAAYFAATRGFCGTPTTMHFLLLRDRFALPDDALEEIERQRNIAGYMLGRHPEAALSFLDTPTLSQEQIEASLAGLATLAAPVAPSLAGAEPPAATLPPPAETPENTAPAATFRKSLFALIKNDLGVPPPNPAPAPSPTQPPVKPPPPGHPTPGPAPEPTMFPRLAAAEQSRTVFRTMDPALAAMPDPVLADGAISPPPPQPTAPQGSAPINAPPSAASTASEPLQSLAQPQNAANAAFLPRLRAQPEAHRPPA